MAATEKRGVKRLGASVRDGVVAVEVGPERVKYYIHKALLVEHSEYFQKALSGPWKEAEEKSVCLDDVECSTFEVFVGWLYHRELPPECTNWVEDKLEDAIFEHEWHTAVQIARVKACTLGARLLSSTFCRATEHDLVEYLINENRPYYEVVIYAFAHLPPSSPVLQAMIDVHCDFFYEGIEKALDKEGGCSEMMLREQLPHSFLVGVMLRYAKIQKGAQVEFDRCDYHGHTTEDERNHCQEKSL